jgi:glycogen operon protein
MNDFDVETLSVIPGRPYPMGTTVYDKGVRFTIFSRHARRVWVALFRTVEDREPVWEYEFDPKRHRTGDVWSIFVKGIGEGVFFLYRMDGPWSPREGHRFNPTVYLLDPYAKAFVGDIHNGTMKCVAVHDRMEWHDDVRPHIPARDLVIYEAHVRGMTRHRSSGAAHPGTYRGFIEKIPYLRDLGINAVELLPVHEMGEDLLGRSSISGGELRNYWGYSTIGFCAPTGRYAVNAAGSEHLDEFRDMVKALHDAGIEVILDVVFNHTSEGNERGPTLSFRGIDNTIYYLLEDGAYLNYSGCGNTLNCGHPLVRDFILDCLRYWVAIMHIDGFRFDLASILGRDLEGNIHEDAPLLARIAEDPVLRDVKLIAEAWDAGGAYQVGSFGGERWAEWNGQYRDDVRRFWRGDPGMRGRMATRLTGSADLYARSERTALHSINFITCHDGFTLCDLVSHNRKHNEINGEENTDGLDDNVSWNCGVEGDTDDPGVNALRLRMQKNFLATLFVSLGVPMLLSGDEFGRTQRGNNNAYCQDNEISWIDWSLLKKNAELHRFCRGMIAFRRQNPALRRAEFFTGVTPGTPEEEADFRWLDENGESVAWDAERGTLMALVHRRENCGTALCLAFNATAEDAVFMLPGGPWQVRVDTAAAPPGDFVPANGSCPVTRENISLAARSMVILASPGRMLKKI